MKGQTNKSTQLSLYNPTVKKLISLNISTSLTHFSVVFSCWHTTPALLSLSVLGWLRGFIQSELGAALDDPWPTGRVEGSPGTPLPIHVRPIQKLNVQTANEEPTQSHV